MTHPTTGQFGFCRDVPDHRDYAFDDHEVQGILRISSAFKASPDAVLPVSADLRKWCSHIEDQGPLQSSSAHAVTGLIEYFDRRAFNKHSEVSRLFIYRGARDLISSCADEGVNLRHTLKALAVFGAPPERLYPYDASLVNAEPPARCYSFSEAFRTMRYFRLDPPSGTGGDVVLNVRRCLAARLPLAFGFPVYSSMPRIGDGVDEIPYPFPGEQYLGGQAVLAVGYDDERMVGPHQGALLVRNSWGRDWGDRGYGWLSYKWLEERMAVDFWSYVRPDFVNTDLFN